MIQCCSLSKRFENVEAVKDISMQVPDGTFLGLLGPNGAGKTTLMRMMTGLLVPDSGTVEFDGRPMDRNAVAVKQSVGVASQHINLDKELTVEENMEFTGRLYRMRKADITASTDRLLAYLGLESGPDEAGPEPVRRYEAQIDDCKGNDPQSSVSLSR